jgi:hypothetical protein
MFISRDHTGGQGSNNTKLLVAKKSFQNTESLKYLDMIVTNQNCIHEETESKLNLGSTCYHAVTESFVFPPAV